MKDFCLCKLGFQLDWEHRFTSLAPLYAQVSRSGLTLHLSEHHGNASPGSTADVTMHGIDAFWSELTARNYPYRKPGIETVNRGRVLTVIDPFSNQVWFREHRGTDARQVAPE
ncbi:MAG: glyoxalase superfamily protein [Chloroflexota bacterium]|nr:glyoxalase superfamily protein [Chloroflexota bacterium]